MCKLNLRELKSWNEERASGKDLVRGVALRLALEVWHVGREKMNKDRDREVWNVVGGVRDSEQLSEHLLRAN